MAPAPQPVPQHPAAAHPPHPGGPSAGPTRATRVTGRRARRFAAATFVGALGLGAAGCLAPGPPGPPPAVAAAIQNAFGDQGPSVVSCMTDIAWRESRWDPSARNPSGASGLFQLMLPLHDDLFLALGGSPAAWSDPHWNALAARELWDGAGVAPWGGC